MPLTIFNLSTVDHLYIGKDTVIAFAEQPVLETYNIELASEDKIKEHLAKPRNWVPQRHETLPEIPHDTAFLCSPADVPGPHKVQLQDKDITTDIRQKFEELCDEYGEAFSKNNEDIGRTKLVKMDIDTGDSPPVSSRPYTLPLKHYEWVQREIESLEHADVITKSMSKWASPIVIVPKKSAPGEPLKRRLCVDFRKVNELQQEVITAGKTKGQISIHPLPKIDEMYAKLKGAKVFSTIDLRSGYHHIALRKSSRAKTAFVTPFGKYEFLMVPFGLAQAPAYFQLLMNKILKGLKFAMTYLDDIIIFSQDELQHLEHLEIVFSCLREAGLKMKHSKCDFFKSEIHYLGHLISPEGISPLPNKLDSIKHMPNSTKEIKQFLGLTGYYRKFVPRFADISRPLTTLTKKDVKFKWTSACQKSFKLLKEALCGESVLKYADTSKPYTLYTDASKYGWAGVLTQPHITTIDDKSTTTDHPIAFVSGLFRGSQLNWAALTKEAFAIYMSVKKLLFYLTDAQILLRSDHKPLEKFLLKNTLNSKVNNWAMELEAFNIQFDYIKGSSNILADTLSRLIAIDPDTPTTPEEPGYEFGYAIFEEFPKVKTKTYEVNEVIVGTDTEIFKNNPELQNSLQCIENPIAPQRLKKLQQQDPNIKILKCKLQNNRLDKEYYSLDENELLTRKVIDGGHKFRAIYLPSVLIFQVLRTAHDDLGHNGFPRTYAALKRVFFWKGMEEDIRKHCKTCATCQLHKLENVKFERKIFKPSLQPMDFICMDLIGEFHPPTSHGHHYVLTAVCMLTGFTWCVPLKTKTAEEVAKVYMDHIYCNFGGSIKILTDNETEFKNKLFKEVVSKLGTEFSIHSPSYRPQSNGKIEGFHRFLKMCIGKHINYGLGWDELTPMATACYNFFPNCSARESAFFVMFGRDPINKLNMLLHSARRYFHDDNGLPNLEALKNIYQVVAQQLLNSREQYMKKHHNQQRSESPVQAGDLILIKDNTAKSFEPLYKGNYRVVKVHGNNVEIRDYRGNISMVHITDEKKITLTEQVADEYEKLGKEGRFSKKCIPRGYIPDFDWTTIHQSQDQPIKPIQQQDPTEGTTTPAAPTEVEGPPSSHLRSKTKQQHTSHKQEQPERNPTRMDPSECNPAEIEVNSIDITPKSYSWMRLTQFLSYSGKTIDNSAPVSLP